MRFVLDFLYAFMLIVASPWLAFATHRDDGWRNVPGRFGFGWPAGEGRVWLHGSSVGEVGLLAPLAAALEARVPGTRILITSHTNTGIAAARARYRKVPVMPLPFDFSFVGNAVLRRTEPAAIVVVESDLWPNLFRSALARGIPVIVLNARISERSLRLHRQLGILPRLMRRIGAVGAQNGEQAKRFELLGAPASRISVTGNMKYDLNPEPDPDLRASVRQGLGIAAADLVVVAASLHLPEDEVVLDCHARLSKRFPEVRLVIVPRYPADGGTMAAHAQERGFATVQRSAASSERLGVGEVLIADTLGELRAFYHAADIAFVGGSLHFRGASKGGHNLMEPAILGIPVIFGPYHFSFRETVADLRSADAAIEVTDAGELEAALTRFLASPDARATHGARARQVVLDRRGATESSLALLAPLLSVAHVAAQPATDDNAPTRT